MEVTDFCISSAYFAIHRETVENKNGMIIFTMLHLQNIQEQPKEKPEQYAPEEEWIKENEDWV